MLFRKAKAEPPQIDRRGNFRTAVYAGLLNAFDGYRSTDWSLYNEVASDLEEFAKTVRACVPAGRS
jgi:hypothetical protein